MPGPARADFWDMDQLHRHSDRRSGYLNIVLTVIAVLLALLVVDGRIGRPLGAASEAQAQPATDDPAATNQALVSASEQRKMMISELRRIASRLDRVESKLSNGIPVKVTEMPAARADK